jgi:alkanesulfonate monooxygenase SsuD/methylene tetrahydromethanopterin reductase-like flavin-dependent oxidoreductase (luciferase family)
MIAVNVISDDDPERVRALSLPGQLSFLRMRQGAKPQPVSIDEALAYDFSPLEEEFIATRNARQAIGTPDEVKSRLESLLASTGVDELMVSSGAATVEGRIRSLEVVREALSSEDAPPAGDGREGVGAE